jgi:putative endonuclease
MINNYVPKKFYVYIVKCSDGTFYTGKTNDLPRRLLQHNGELINGARYTRTRRPVELMFYEEYLTNGLACQREQEIKHLSHDEKNDLIYYRNQKINNQWLHRY